MDFIASVLVNWRWSPEGEDLVELLLCNCSVLLQQMKNPLLFAKNYCSLHWRETGVLHTKLKCVIDYTLLCKWVEKRCFGGSVNQKVVHPPNGFHGVSKIGSNSQVQSNFI